MSVASYELFLIRHIRLWIEYESLKSSQINFHRSSVPLCGKWHTSWSSSCAPHPYKSCCSMLSIPPLNLQIFLPGKMNSKAFTFLSLLFAVVLLTSFMVSAETSLDEKNGQHHCLSLAPFPFSSYFNSYLQEIDCKRAKRKFISNDVLKHHE